MFKKRVFLHFLKNPNFSVHYHGITIYNELFYYETIDTDLVFNDKDGTISITIPLGQPDPIRATGTVYKYQNTINRYPSRLGENSDYVNLLSTMMDFTLFSGLHLENGRKVTIEFNHSDNFTGTAVCVFWNIDDFSWNENGCKAKSRQKNRTVCECDHLTNFGLLFGGADRPDPQSPYKDELTKILTGFSIACLLATQVVLHLGKLQQPGLRKTVDINRNYCLILAYIMFSYLTDSVESGIGCSTVTFITHYVWLAVFAWTSKKSRYIFCNYIFVSWVTSQL